MFLLGSALAWVQAGAAVAAGSIGTFSISPQPGSQAEPGRGTFLVAKRSLEDPSFGQSVVYLVVHGDGGSIGLIVNRRSNLALADTVPDFAPALSTYYRLYFGGPVELSMVLMLARGEPSTEGLLPVADGISISSERPVMEAALGERDSPQELRFYLGYAGWADGQLAAEMTRGSWHVVPADPDAIFAADTVSLWERLIERLEPEGIQVEHGSDDAVLASRMEAP